jgi:hypothetical protein
MIYSKRESPTCLAVFAMLTEELTVYSNALLAW